MVIDGQFYPAKANLAMLYNSQGKNQEAEKLLREVVDQEPELYEISYSLGLLLAEMQQYEAAELYLGRAAAGINYARAYYNHGQVLLVLNQPERAEQALVTALLLDPMEQDFLVALADYYLRTGQVQKARDLADRLLRQHPGHEGARELKDYLSN